MPRLPLRLGNSLAAGVARHGGWLTNLTISLLLALLGWVAVQWREVFIPRQGDQIVDYQEKSMDWFQRFSFDVPFVIRFSLPGLLRPVAGPLRSTDEVVILYMDEESARKLNQPAQARWSRALHAQLLDRLSQDGARAVMFDAIFDTESPEEDPLFARALANNGKTFLGTAFDSDIEAPVAAGHAERARLLGLAADTLIKRDKVLYQAARGWGLLTFRPLENDFGVNRIFTGKPREEGLDPWPAATWEVARALGTKLTEDSNPDRFARRWVNFYGPPRRIEGIGYFRVLVENSGVPSGYFKDKVVLIGARSQLGSGSRKLLDEFSTPWSRLHGRTYMAGTEIHATVLLNLLHHDWLERIPLPTERWVVVLLGLALGTLRWLRPWRILLVVGLATFLLFAGSCLLQWHAHRWWNWAAPVFLQMPLGVVLAIGSRYYIEERRKRKLRSAFGFYLSPDLASEIAERNFTLAPGGEKVVATMVFTDLEGFTTLSEKLGDSARLGSVLTDYFTRTTDEILAERGTVIKFIGDAVFAAWGAPLPQADHAERAVRAAWRLAQVSETDVTIPQADGTTDVVHVRTRIGIHTGEALAGNLGSARRFDYTLIGDAVNFAARLEGANKYTGTAILLSDDTAKLLGGKFLLRRLGAFKVKGKAKSVVIHELLGDNPAARPPWLDTFDAALAAWTAGDFAAARTGFEAVKAARADADGPAQFYLDRVGGAILSPAWTGEVELEGK